MSLELRVTDRVGKSENICKHDLTSIGRVVKGGHKEGGVRSVMIL